MSGKNTMGKKDVLQAESVQSFAEKAQAYLQENLRQIAAIGLVICVVGALIGFWVVKQARSEEEAASLFYRAMNFMAQVPADAVKADIQYNQALEGFKSVNQTYSGTKAGVSSLFYAGNCCYKLKKFDEAVSFYMQFLDQGGQSMDYLRPLTYESLAYAHESKGEYDRALEWFEKQRKDAPMMENPTCLLNIARCYEKKGDTGKACTAYKDFLEKYTSSAFKELAQSKTAALCAP